MGHRQLFDPTRRARIQPEKKDGRIGDDPSVCFHDSLCFDCVHFSVLLSSLDSAHQSALCHNGYSHSIGQRACQQFGLIGQLQQCRLFRARVGSHGTCGSCHQKESQATKSTIKRSKLHLSIFLCTSFFFPLRPVFHASRQI